MNICFGMALISFVGGRLEVRVFRVETDSRFQTVVIGCVRAAPMSSFRERCFGHAGP
jgi:hypothetical protein